MITAVDAAQDLDALEVGIGPVVAHGTALADTERDCLNPDYPSLW